MRRRVNVRRNRVSAVATFIKRNYDVLLGCAVCAARVLVYYVKRTTVPE